ncbi:alpha/beta fold hydrolase [Pseudoalteromonas sp. T1lg23B]|uniref:alpha/beta fold hydrolase n=1 Tax=Pseudoalteromonas sp. T1lg23B TaxID=2077097 RepID=UPI000CF6F8C1|nr:alpha/beta hydrolase [Pseudoalteromonas sp. T1lg23B]
MSGSSNLKLTMVPGTQCNHRLWERLIPRLNDLIQPNHVAIESCTTRKQMLAEIDQALAFGGHLLGFSMGGYLALQYALEHPNNVHSLVLIASSALGLSEGEKQARKGMQDFLQTHTYNGMSNARMREFISPHRWQDNALLSVIKDMDKTLGGATLLKQIQATSSRQDLSGLLAKLQCKVLIIGAQQDQKVACEDLQAMAKLLPDAELLLLEDCGHMVPLEQPQVLAQILNQFCLGR